MNVTGKSFYIKTLGCKVNQYESQVIREQLLKNKCFEVGPNSEPDICIINTCSVTNRAQAKGRHYARSIHKKYPQAKIIVTGCTVDYQSETFSAVSGIDSLFSNFDKFSIVATPGSEDKKNIITGFAGHNRAFVKIQDGCNQFCSYCVLPYIRGRSRSRAEGDIINEIKGIIANGYKEIVLTGIRLGDYNNNAKGDLPQLLDKLELISGLERIRLSSIEPQDITPLLIEKMAVNKKFCHHLHIPLQSGDDVILKLMNRTYLYKYYKKLLENLRDKITDISFSTDIIVGFPGEDEQQFNNTCKAVKELSFIKVHVFPYSKRPKTVAANLSNEISSNEIKRRVKVLEEISNKTAFEEKKKLVGTRQSVLVEKGATGYTKGYVPVLIEGKVKPNTVIDIIITDIKEQKLIGKCSNGF